MKVNLVNKSNRRSLPAIIEGLVETDYPKIAESGNYGFDWSLERYNDVYKIYLTSNNDDILGLMSIYDEPKENCIHLNLLELHSEQTGKNKTIQNIAGCLIAFAVRIAFERGYGGLVVLEPKNVLFDHYKKVYGFEEAGYVMFTQGKNSKALVNKYLYYEK